MNTTAVSATSHLADTAFRILLPSPMGVMECRPLPPETGHRKISVEASAFQNDGSEILEKK